MDIQDIPSNSSVIPFPTQDHYALEVIRTAELLAAIGGILLNSLVCYILFKQRLNIANKKIFFFTLIASDLVASIIFSFFQISNWSQGGWAFGSLGCYASAGMMAFFLGTSLISLNCLTLSLFLQICFRLEAKDAFKYLRSHFCFSFFAMIALCTAPFVAGKAGTTFALKPDLNQCFLAWWNSKDTFIMTICIIIVLAINLYVAFFAVAYSCMFITYRSTKRRLFAYSLSEQERQILFRSIFISAAFVVAYMPTIGKGIWQMVYRDTVSALSDEICNMFLVLIVLIDPLILVLTDPIIRSEIRDILLMHQQRNGITKMVDRNDTGDATTPPIQFEAGFGFLNPPGETVVLDEEKMIPLV